MEEKYTELLTAFVDGELAPQQRDQALRLLNQSSKARTLLAQLQANAHALKQLPQRALEASFADDVMAAINAPAINAPAVDPVDLPAAPPVLSRTPAFIRYALAASILLVLGGSALFIYRNAGDAGTVGREPVVGELNKLPVDEPPPVPENLFAFDQLPEQREKLETMLDDKKGVHLEVAVADAAGAIDRVSAVLKDKGIRVLTDKNTRKSLKNDQGGQFMVYLENLKPAELAQILERVGAGEKESKNFKNFEVHAMDGADRTLLARQFGVDAEEFDPDHESLFSGNFIVAPNNPKAGEPPRKPPEHKASARRYAVVLSDRVAPSQRTGFRSPEVLTFLGSRRSGSTPGTLQVLLVFRNASA